MNREIPGAQLRAWTLAAAAGPILSIVGRDGWMTVLIVAVAAGALSFCVLSCKRIKPPRWLCVVELVWLAVFLGEIGKISGTCWNGDAFLAIPVILIFMGAFASRRGGVPAARTGATLVWVVIPVLAIVAIAGVADVNTSWIRMEVEIPDSLLIGLLLVPCLCTFLPAEPNTGMRWSAALLGVIAVIAALLVDGTVGGDVAARAENSFYELSKSINLFGVAERFEALIACMLTGSWFALFTLILSAGYHLLEDLLPAAGKYGIWLVATVGVIFMYLLPSDGGWIAVGTLIFWGFLPVVTQGVVSAKNMQKK